MYLSRLQSRTMAAFMEALLPAEQFKTVRQNMGTVGNDLFDAHRFDDPYIQKSVPFVFTLLQWLPILCFWLIWKPIPFTALSIDSRQKLFHKLEHSRIYGLRGLFLAGKMFSCMIFFHDESTWDYVGFDNKGELPQQINPTDLDRLRQSNAA